MIVVYAVLAGVLAAVGTAQLLQRTLTRIVIGVVLIGQAANLLLLIAGGEPGSPPLVGAPGPVSDPLPQALALTAIVITFAILSFLLGIAWRAARLTGDDRVEDDLEDRRVARMTGVADPDHHLYDPTTANRVYDPNHDPAHDPGGEDALDPERLARDRREGRA